MPLAENPWKNMTPICSGGRKKSWRTLGWDVQAEQKVLLGRNKVCIPLRHHCHYTCGICSLLITATRANELFPKAFRAHSKGLWFVQEWSWDSSYTYHVSERVRKLTEGKGKQQNSQKVRKCLKEPFMWQRILRGWTYTILAPVMGVVTHLQHQESKEYQSWEANTG